MLYTIKETAQEWKKLNPFFETNQSIKKYDEVQKSLVNVTYDKSELDTVSQCQLTKEVSFTEVGGAPILSNYALLIGDLLKIKWTGAEEEVLLTLKATLKSSTGTIVHELSITTKLTILDICEIDNELTMAIDGDIFISNAIRATKVTK